MKLCRYRSRNWNSHICKRLQLIRTWKRIRYWIFYSGERERSVSKKETLRMLFSFYFLFLFFISATCKLEQHCFTPMHQHRRNVPQWKCLASRWPRLAKIVIVFSVRNYNVYLFYAIFRCSRWSLPIALKLFGPVRLLRFRARRWNLFNVFIYQKLHVQNVFRDWCQKLFTLSNRPAAN